ncbi:MAG: GNAT family N-acetyltransferase [Spirochaetales bacterium]|nr:GNAT family N-acetyltransferase [Spirochaetales bacterium]
MDWKIETSGREGLGIIKPLWEKLNEIHRHDSRHFKDFYSGFTFEERMRSFDELIDGNFHLQIVYAGHEAMGYCISTARGNIGEIDSIYLDEKARGSGLGSLLVENAMLWMRGRKCSRFRVSVADGHESVLEFYGKLGFLPRLSVLEYSGD